MSKKDKSKKKGARNEAERTRKETDDFIRRFNQEKRATKNKPNEKRGN